MSVCCALGFRRAKFAAVFPGGHALRPAKTPGKVRPVGKAQAFGGLSGGASGGQQFPGPLHFHGGKGFHGAAAQPGAESLLQPGAADPQSLTDFLRRQFPGKVFGKIHSGMVHQGLLVPLLAGAGAQPPGAPAPPA